MHRGDLTKNNTALVSNWLFFVAGMVLCMAVIGAITRLTESGLSITQWQPISGILPPLNDADWDRAFALYRETPEFRDKHFWMEMADFKQIFFWEWLHRLWGRLIGVVYALPLLWFWVTKRIPEGYKAPLLGLLLLGGMQGVMGWVMVQSGLVDRPSVSHYRLAAHLSLAFILFGSLLWTAFSLRQAAAPKASFCIRRHGWSALALLSLTIVWGAFTAGMDGGMVYNTWPLMDGRLIPAEAGVVSNLISNPAGAQFVHRWIAIAAAAAVLTFAWRVKNGPLAGMVFVQVALGVATVISQVSLPLAALHQAGAFVLIALMLHALHRQGGARSSVPA